MAKSRRTQGAPGATPALQLLQREGVAHEVRAYDHDPAVTDYGLEAAEALDVEPARVFKTLLADLDGELVVAVVPVTGRLDLKALAAALGGKKATMADPRAAERTTGYIVGGISPLGQRKRLRTVIDRSAEAYETVLVSAGRRGLDVELAPGELVRMTGATVAEVAGVSRLG